MMSENKKPKSRLKQKGLMMAMGIAGLLITFAWIALQELR